MIPILRFGRAPHVAKVDGLDGKFARASSSLALAFCLQAPFSP